MICYGLWDAVDIPSRRAAFFLLLELSRKLWSILKVSNTSENQALFDITQVDSDAEVAYVIEDSSVEC